MNHALIACSMCGHQFDPKDHPSCKACPLQSGCQLVCCPNCGFESVDVQRSKLARMVARLLPGRKERLHSPGLTLADAERGRWVKVIRYSPGIPQEKKAHLQAYGLVDGHMVRVLGHSPVTVVQVDHTELALEKSLASEVQVEILG